MSLNAYPLREVFGTVEDGKEVHRITLACGRMSCSVLTYGGALQTLCVDGIDVVLGFDTMSGYQNQPFYIGALVGRYANRISHGRFSLNGTEYVLATNDGDHHLHGGNAGFDKRLWTVEELSADKLTLSLFSPDGEEGYPGNLKVCVTYRLTENALMIDYEGVSDADTLCNLTNHAYFNLNGHSGGDVSGHLLQICAQRYDPVDSGLIPLGDPILVEGTDMDLRTPQAIGKGMDSDEAQLVQAGGYDHNWLIDGEVGTLRPAASVSASGTELSMCVETTMPGMQLFVSRFSAQGLVGKGDTPYIGRCGFCLETQFFPNSPNRPDVPQALLRAGERMHHRTVFRFE